MSAAPEVLSHGAVGTRHRAIAPRKNGRPWTFYVLAAVFTLYVIALYGPMICIYILSFQDVRGGLVFPMKGFSLHWFVDLFTQVRTGDVKGSFDRSIKLAALVTMITVVVSFMAGLAFRRRFLGDSIVFYLMIGSLVAETLEQVLKPIGFTEQAAAVMDRDAAELALSDAEFRVVVDKGKGYRGTDYVEAMHRRSQLRGRFLEIFRSVDALVTPTVAVTAFEAGTIGVGRIDDRTVDPHLGWSPFSWPINLAGLPAASVPCGFDEEGLPIGLQIVAPWLEEALIFRIAAAFEAARPWAHVRPRPPAH